jgi:6-pyruvoyl-tetrahydropterin synthase related domain
MKNSIPRCGPPLLAALAGVLALLPVMIWGIPNNNDLANHYHFALPFYDAIQQGNLHPGWFASPNFGYGDAVVRFYPPALYYVLAAGRALTGNWYAGTLFALTLVSALGSLGAYVWARSFVPPHIAIWAGVFYAFMPYHLAEVYQASQLAEFAAGAALLFALAFTKRLCDHGRLRDVTGLAIAYALLLLTHLPLAVFGSLALLIYACLNLPRDHKSVTILKLAAAVSLGLAASAFYWTSMVAEMRWIIADGVNPDPLLDYRKNFVFSSFSPEKNETIWWMGLLAIATIAMSLPAIVIFTGKFGGTRARHLPAVGLLAAFSLFMCTALSKPLWAVIPFLRMAQHPFRWLAVASAIAPIVMAASLPFWVERFRRRTRPVALAMAGLVIVAMTFSISQTVRGATYLSRPAFDQMLVALKEAPGIIQWLPIWANATARGKASFEKCVPPTGAQLEAGSRTARTVKWDALSRTFEVGPGPSTDARVSTYYYPHWRATANGKALATRPGPDGALLISLPPEQVTIDLEFREPPRAKVSTVTSIISWTLLASLLIFGWFARTRRSYDSTESSPTPAP